ncbi:MAG: EscU/YscU/HrcU family type III secretion system export apparatus switch protein [Archangiaceae bacterium]|nr:EscU/YscU/HrcU family type III secretion system export apparatus switch protein [Archangiaceae bacterium]
MSGEKTEKPSEQKLREARQKGQIARSRLFNAAAVTFGGLLGFSFADVGAELHALAAHLLSSPDLPPANALAESVRVLAAVAAAPLLGALLASLTVSLAAAGLQVNVGHVAPQLERIDPFKGLARLFTVSQAVEVLKGLLVTAVIGWVMWRGAREAAASVSASVARSGPLAMNAALAALEPLVFRGAVVLLLLGAGDYALARRKHSRELMMSREDLKQEHKSSEGDPQHKAKRKQLHQQISAGGPARGVQKATAIVVNPTHIAVALRYDETECEAPYLVAKGREEDALKIRKQAGELDIPVVKDVPLARTLVNFDVGEEVPEELYQAAAAILKVALERKETDERRKKVGAP